NYILQKFLNNQFINKQKIIMNNIQPRTREERGAIKDKEAMEKIRINQRVGYETRNTNVKQLLHNSDPTSTLFIPENQRFDKDFAVYDKALREQKFQQKEFQQEKHRLVALERDQFRWKQIEEKDIKEQKKLEHKGHVLVTCKRNTNGQPFNPITLEYEKSQQGEILKTQDEKQMVRGLVRAKNLDIHSNCGYDIFTGEEKLELKIQFLITQNNSINKNQINQMNKTEQYQKEKMIIIYWFQIQIKFHYLDQIKYINIYYNQ
ncbi:hypothetical protein IMG5_194420, partial [Ichthyophthirius multifiliis]